MFGEQIIKSVIDAAVKYIPDPAARDKFNIEILTLQSQSEQAQVEVNKVEAANDNIFVSGWRPFIGWICGSAMAYHFILQPLLAFIFAIFNHPITLPAFDMNTLYTVLMGMLGLGGMRTIEKLKR